MSSGGMILTRLAAALALAAGCLAAAGCVRSPEAQFKFNALFAQQKVKRSESFDAKRAQEIVDITRAMFGTPDAPFLPAEAVSPADDVIDRELLALSAGPVKTSAGITRGGLYRQHCVHCHGISGDGQGPTGLYLNPYPRDYRPGVYKFKSTPKGAKPTHDDLRKIIVEGIPGTAMPSFKLLTSDEIESLVNYVKYLTIRGEVERNLIDMSADFSPDDPATSADEYEPIVGGDPTLLLETFYAPAVASWRDAPGTLKDVPSPPDWTKEQRATALAEGQKLFYGLGACKDCHGESQLGDGTIDNYDEWSTYLSPAKNPEGIDVYLALGAFPPRPIRPRNLRSGVYRGGRRPLDLFWRVRNGIDGSGMPAAAATVTDEQVWQIVEFVKSLPFEPISDPFHGHEQTYQKPRN